MKDPIFLDYNATTPLRHDVRACMLELMGLPLNASSVHGYGRKGRTSIEEAREHIAKLVDTSPTQIIFNSGATEANNTVIHHFNGQKIAASTIEHPSILETRDDLIHIPVEPNGLINLNMLEEILKAERPALTCVMLVNNETGVIQPIEKISALTKKYGSLLHCDAVQALERIPININEMGIDFLSISSHKIGGPQGIGALALGICGITPTLLHGGGQEKSARAGTENVAGIAGFGKAAELTSNPIDNFQDYLEKKLLEISPEIIIHGKDSPRITNTTLFSLPGARSENMLMALDLDGIAISNGSACSSGSVKASHVLRAMGVEENIATGTLRISTGWNTTQENIDAFLTAWQKLYARLMNK